MDEDIDGVPIGKLADELSNSNKNKTILSASSTNNKNRAFIPSKWETVDPEQIEAQAITTSKWDTLDAPSSTASSTSIGKTTSVKVRNAKSLLKSSGTKPFKYYDNSSGEEDQNDLEEDDDNGDNDEDEEDDEGKTGKVDDNNKDQHGSISEDEDQCDDEKYNYNKVKRKQIKRDIERKVLEYRDELESGQQPLKSGWTIGEQLNHYRKRLTKKVRFVKK